MVRNKFPLVQKGTNLVLYDHCQKEPAQFDLELRIFTSQPRPAGFNGIDLELKQKMRWW